MKGYRALIYCFYSGMKYTEFSQCILRNHLISLWKVRYINGFANNNVGPNLNAWRKKTINITRNISCLTWIINQDIQLFNHWVCRQYVINRQQARLSKQVNIRFTFKPAALCWQQVSKSERLVIVKEIILQVFKLWNIMYVLCISVHANLCAHTHTHTHTYTQQDNN
jgi:hypothetical protein